MNKVCPVCNRIIREEFPCDSCSGSMMNKGRVDDYLDDYSADMPIEDEGAYCDHVYMCSVCGSMKNFRIKKIST